MPAIRTRYLPATQTRGARIKAQRDGYPSLTLSFDHALDSEDNHKAAALKLMRRTGINTVGVVGGAFESDWYWVAA